MFRYYAILSYKLYETMAKKPLINSVQRKLNLLLLAAIGM